MERSGIEPDGDGCKNLCRQPARPLWPYKALRLLGPTKELGGFSVCALGAGHSGRGRFLTSSRYLLFLDRSLVVLCGTVIAELVDKTKDEVSILSVHGEEVHVRC